MTNGFGTRSLSAKLGYLMAAVICGTVIALTIQSVTKFSDYIQQNIEESSTGLAERAAADISATMDLWISQMAVAVSKLPSSPKAGATDDASLEAALRANRDIWSVNLYSVKNRQLNLIRKASQTDPSTSKKILDPSFSQKMSSLMDLVVADLVDNPAKFVDGRFIKNATPELKIPSIFTAIKLSIPGVENNYAVIAFVVDMTKLQLVLPQSRYTLSYAIDHKGVPFISSDEMRISVTTPLKGNALVQKALLRREPAGFIQSFFDISNREKIGSFAQLPGSMPFFVIIERDRAAAFQVISRVYLSSALWGLLILLLATLLSYISAGTLTKNLRNLVAATSRIAGGDFSVRLQPNTKDEVGVLSHSVNNMASKIQFLMTSEVEKARFEKELETARLVQATFFPKQDIRRPHLTLTGSYQPATECGGDLWGHYTVGEDLELVFIADAMGHGAPAALVTAIAYATCQSVSIILTEQSGVDPTPAQLLNRLNKIIFNAVGGKITMTFFAALFDFKKGTITFANAGHNFPFILTNNQDDARVSAATKRTKTSSGVYPITLNLQGNPLGAELSSEYREKQINLASGDKIIFFTDGLIENYRKDKEPIGRKSLIEFACSVGQQDPTAIRTALEAEGAKIFGTNNLADDVTILVAEVSKTWAAQISTPTSSRDLTPHGAISSTNPIANTVQFPPPPPPPMRTAPQLPLPATQNLSSDHAQTPSFDLLASTPPIPAQIIDQTAANLSNPPVAGVFDLGDVFSLEEKQDSLDEVAQKDPSKKLPSTG